MGARSQDVVLYTIGYEGHSLSSLVRTLKDNNIERLVDVRLRPHSRQKGMSLMSLFERLRKAGIHYDHLGELGNPVSSRSLFFAGEIDKGRRAYRRIITNGKASSVDTLVGLARAQRTAIMCREGNAEDCHRWVIAEVAAERDQGVMVKHL